MHEQFPHLSVKSIFWSTQMCENVIYFFHWKTNVYRALKSDASPLSTKKVIAL